MASSRAIVYIVLLLFSFRFLEGDVIYLKSGREIQGVILESNENSIVVEMAMGKVAFSRDKILKITRDQEGNQRRQEVEDALSYESEILSLKRSVRSLSSEKGTLSVLKLKVSRFEKDVSASEESLVTLKRTFGELSEKLGTFAKYQRSGAPPAIYAEWVEVSSKYEAARSKIEVLEHELTNKRRELAQARGVYNSARAKIVEKLKKVRSQRDHLVEKGCPESALAAIERGLKSFSDIQKIYEIPLIRRGNSFYLTVTLNNRITEEFMLDTGCSGVFLSQAIVRRLKLKKENLLYQGDAIIADGSKIRVQTAILDSVEIGGVSAENVACSYEIRPKVGGSPLLGMSFLERFHFSIDTTRGVLVLE